MRKIFMLGGLLSIAVANGQSGLSDSEYRSIALKIAQGLDRPLRENKAEVIRRSYKNNPESSFIEVNDGEAMVRLSPPGSFKGFSELDPRELIDGENQKGLTEAQAWVRAEKILANLDAPSGLTRLSSRKKQAGNGPPGMYQMVFAPRPHGFIAESGNVAFVHIKQSTGQVVFAAISRGWTYESPNVQIAPEQAKLIAAKVEGGDPSDYASAIKYYASAAQSAPASFRKLFDGKVMRLCYILDAQGKSVIVDSVTGDVVTSGKHGGSAQSGVKSSKLVSKSNTLDLNRSAVASESSFVKPAESKDSDKPRSSDIPAGLFLGVGVAAGIALSVLLFAVRKRV